MRRFPLIALSALAIAALAGEAQAALTYGSDIGSVLMPDIGEPTEAPPATTDGVADAEFFDQDS